jgi:hypothetical protein
LSFVDSASSFACIELVVVTGGTDLEANLGIGRFEAAGEAWKVGPAYAAGFAGVAVGDSDLWGALERGLVDLGTSLLEAARLSLILGLVFLGFGVVACEGRPESD